jgi:hypothetical protein
MAGAIWLRSRPLARPSCRVARSPHTGRGQERDFSKRHNAGDAIGHQLCLNPSRTQSLLSCRHATTAGGLGALAYRRHGRAVFGRPARFRDRPSCTGVFGPRVVEQRLFHVNNVLGRLPT